MLRNKYLVGEQKRDILTDGATTVVGSSGVALCSEPLSSKWKTERRNPTEIRFVGDDSG